jgi:ABC-type polysaccharide/polyol phosphate export permease
VYTEENLKRKRKIPVNLLFLFVEIFINKGMVSVFTKENLWRKRKFPVSFFVPSLFSSD